MAKIFVDAVAWIALINTRDSLHATARSILRHLRSNNRQLVTTEFVLIELANALSSPDFRDRVSVLIDGLILDDDVEIVPSDPALFSSGFELYRSRLDKEWSLVDCASFVVMEQRSITEAFTEDRHIEQAGFTKLL